MNNDQRTLLIFIFHTLIAVTGVIFLSIALSADRSQSEAMNGFITACKATSCFMIGYGSTRVWLSIKPFFTRSKASQ